MVLAPFFFCAASEMLAKTPQAKVLACGVFVFADAFFSHIFSEYAHMYGGVSRVAFEAFKTRRDTFVSGRYPQHGRTGKHAAIYLGQDASGIQVMDQWNSQNQVRRRTIYWHPHSGGLSNDANAFSVIEW
ncbi:hypothetical protein OKW49_005805 [Paraburkholderia youngii]|uniref:BPSL0067 family protein n=1 Tax=Paraburkholderia youngii TaxID=2782701 RepID=UPI003D2018C9